MDRIVDARPHEKAAALSGFAYFFCLLCSYYLLRPLRDALGVSGGPGQLQWLFTATFLAMLVLIPVFGAVATRWPPRRFVPIVYRFFALNILGFSALFAAGVQELAVSRVFFVWISVFNLFVISVFWSVMADHFRNEQGRRLFGFIAAGGTAGAMIGPALAAALVARLGPALLTVIAAVLLELAVQCFGRLVRAAPGRKDEPVRAQNAILPQYDAAVGGGIFAGVNLILREPYLAGIALYLLLNTFASTFLYFEQARIVAATLSGTASRTQFFALVDLAVSCLTIVLQVLITGRFIRRFGIAAALILLPIASLAVFAGIALWPALSVLAAAQGFRRAIDYAIVRPAREVLFTVVSRAAKYKAKSVIETVVYRGGDAVSGWIFAALAAAGIGFSGMAAIFAPLTAIWVGLAAWLSGCQEKRAKQCDLQAEAAGASGLAHGGASLNKAASDKRGFE